MPPMSAAFKDHGNALSDADAHCAERITAAPTVEFSCSSQSEAGATHAQWVAERDRATIGIHVGCIVRDSKLAYDRQGLGGECLVELDDIHLIESEMAVMLIVLLSLFVLAAGLLQWGLRALAHQIRGPAL